MGSAHKEIKLEDGWTIIQEGITRLINSFEGIPDQSPFEDTFKSMLYRKIVTMCTQVPPNECSKELYDRYESVINDYLHSKALPAIQEKQQDHTSMLREYVKKWKNHKVMVSWLSHIFSYLDRFFIHQNSLSSLEDVGIGCFRKIVYGAMKVQVKDVVISLINKERGGEEIDRTLLKDVIQVFVDIGKESNAHNMEYYVNDFEEAFVLDTAEYYTRKAGNLIRDYMIKAVKQEKDRVSHYLHSSTKEKMVLEDIQNGLLWLDDFLKGILTRTTY
ncbi:hypothetical protein MKW92_037821 [Papaver armeniacum]|nr:hypothetical protein MKW92_037821 [Papaver armeniacum]